MIFYKNIWVLLLIALNTFKSQSQPTTSSIDELLAGAEDTRFTNRDSSFLWYSEALSLSDSIQYTKGQVQSRLGLAWVHYIKSDYPTSKKYYRELMNRFSSDLSIRNSIEVYTRTGTMYLNEGVLDTARINFIKVQEIQADAPLELQTNIGTLLSELYYMLGRYQEAEQYALNDYTKFKDGPKQNKAVALYALMQFYLKQKNIDSFIRFNDEYLESIDYENLEPEALKYHYHSMFNDDAGNRDLKKIDLLIEAAHNSGHDHIAIIGYAVLCEQHIKDKNFRAIPVICEKAIAECDVLGWKEQKVIFVDHWANAEAALSNWQKAYALSAQLAQINQEIKSEQSQQRIDELEVKFETSEKESKLQQQQYEIERKTRQRNISYLVIGAILLLTISVYLGLKKIIEKNKQLASQAQKIQAQKIEHLEASNKINIMDSIMTGQEGERKRIANDLHDGLGSLMMSIKSHYNHIEKEFKELKQFKIYKKTGNLLDQAVTEVRRISHNMMPKTLIDYGLKGAVIDLGTSIQEAHGLEVNVEVIGLEQNIPPNDTVMIYRIIQEAVNNIIKHAQADNLFIQLVAKEDRLFILVEDDGIGFDLQEAMAKKVFGLKSLESRVKYLLGNFTIDSTPGVGTTIMADFPIRSQLVQ